MKQQPKCQLSIKTKELIVGKEYVTVEEVIFSLAQMWIPNTLNR